MRKSKGTIVVLFFKVEKEENLVVPRWTKLGKKNHLSEGGSEWRRVLCGKELSGSISRRKVLTKGSRT